MPYSVFCFFSLYYIFVHKSSEPVGWIYVKNMHLVIFRSSSVPEIPPKQSNDSFQILGKYSKQFNIVFRILLRISTPEIGIIVANKYIIFLILYLLLIKENRKIYMYNCIFNFNAPTIVLLF